MEIIDTRNYWRCYIAKIILYYSMSNTSKHDVFDKVVLLAMLEPVSFIGVLANCSFLVFNYYIATSKKDYYLFFYALSIVDVIFCLSIFVSQPFLTVLDVESDTLFCKILGCITVASGNCAISTQTLLSFHRYICLYHSKLKKKFFSTRNNIIMLVAVFVIPVLQ